MSANNDAQSSRTRHLRPSNAAEILRLFRLDARAVFEKTLQHGVERPQPRVAERNGEKGEQQAPFEDRDDDPPGRVAAVQPAAQRERKGRAAGKAGVCPAGGTGRAGNRARASGRRGHSQHGGACRPHRSARAPAHVHGNVPRDGGRSRTRRGKRPPRRTILRSKRKRKKNAGKSPPALALCHVIEDHPRVCGEKPGTQRPAVGHIGSPPRMRGKVKKPTMNRKKRRITPAYAGKRRA